MERFGFRGFDVVSGWSDCLSNGALSASEMPWSEWSVRGAGGPAIGGLSCFCTYCTPTIGHKVHDVQLVNCDCQIRNSEGD